MKKNLLLLTAMILMLSVSPVFAAYHHEGEQDAEKFLEIYPEKADTKLDHCATCHSGGEYEKKGAMVPLGSCQWCHHSYGYDGSGNIVETLNQYGKDYYTNGRTAAAVTAIKTLDSDGDGYTNDNEIAAERFPGDAGDDPSKTTASYRIYTRAQLEAMDQHTQFLLMNTARSGDYYSQYSGVPIKVLLDHAGIEETATGITVFAPDGWSQYHPLEYDENPEFYHVYGNMPGQTYQYPQASYYYVEEAEQWCDYSSPYCTGRTHQSPIVNENGLKAILALKIDGVDLDAGVLNDENKLDGSGPFRVVVPQKNPNAPDQSSKSDDQNVTWPYDYDWDHNAGACTRSATIIRVEPLPEGTTDLDVYEDGWNYVDEGKIIIYGAIDGTDSNGNGILDSEEGSDTTRDFDGDGTPDYKDIDTASFMPATGNKNLLLCASKGALCNVKALKDDNPELSQTNKPDLSFPYGVSKFEITGLSEGESITVSIVFPDNVPTTAKYYKITDGGWNEILFGSNDGDTTITLTLTDGDTATDADGKADGKILDPGALAVESSDADESGDDRICFIASTCNYTPVSGAGSLFIALVGITFFAIQVTRMTKNLNDYIQ